MTNTVDSKPKFSFFKGGQDAVAPASDSDFDWEAASLRVREHVQEAFNAHHVAFLFGSGCSSLVREGKQLGVPTMAPLANEFLAAAKEPPDASLPSTNERATLSEVLGLDLDAAEFKNNLERLLEVLYSFDFALSRSTNEVLTKARTAIATLIPKVLAFITKKCDVSDESVVKLYQSFYRKLLYRDRALPRPWIFTTNYDLLNELAIDRLGIPYCNGFSGSVERRFNPATYRYSLAEQLDLSNRKWTAVDTYLYLCKLHGSVSWVEEGESLFPIRERVDLTPSDDRRTMIYPAPMKQAASFGAPYSDLFREFQSRIVREQSVLFVLGYSFGDEHVNNIIFQALTIPTFRLVALVPSTTSGVVGRLRSLDDPRIWLLSGDGPTSESKAHHFATFVDSFMPEPPADKVDTAINNVLKRLLVPPADSFSTGGEQ